MRTLDYGTTRKYPLLPPEGPEDSPAERRAARTVGRGVALQAQSAKGIGASIDRTLPELHDHSLSEAGAAPAAAVAVGGPLRRRDPPTDPNPLHISPADRYDRTRYRSRPSRNPHRMPRTARDLASRTSPANETRQLVTAMPEQHVPPDEKTLSIRQQAPRQHDCRDALGNS